ncbi:hypothetical protein [Hydrotalea flava]|nr:hypothetical protein [Hydrotalea flava]
MVFSFEALQLTVKFDANEVLPDKIFPKQYNYDAQMQGSLYFHP